MCSSLHNFDICSADPYLSREWLILIDTISFVPKAALRHLTLRLDACGHYPSPWTYPLLDWPALRNVCSQFDKLSSVMLAGRSPHSDTLRAQSDADLVRSNTREFHDRGLLYLEYKGSAPSCTQAGCCWYRKM